MATMQRLLVKIQEFLNKTEVRENFLGRPTGGCKMGSPNNLELQHKSWAM